MHITTFPCCVSFFFFFLNKTDFCMSQNSLRTVMIDTFGYPEFVGTSLFCS